MSAEELHEIVRSFESTTLPLGRWHHREHLIVATWYLTELGETDGIEALREGIQRYNDAQGVEQTPRSGYHDSFTVFFARGIGAFLAELPSTLDFPKRCERVFDYFSDFRTLAQGYYSEDVFESWAGRTTWIEPDLKPLSEWLKNCRKAARVE